MSFTLHLRSWALAVAAAVVTITPCAVAAQPPPPVVIVVTDEPPVSSVATAAEVAAVATATDTPAIGNVVITDASAEDLETDDPSSDDLWGDEEGSRWWSIGASATIGTRPSGGDLAPTWMFGVDLSLRLDRLVAIGLRRIRVDGYAADRVTIGAAPFVELTLSMWDELIEGYGQLGLVLDAHVPSQGRLRLEGGLAPFVTAGVRFFLAPIFSVAVEGTALVPVAGTITTGDVALPELSVALSLGLAIAFHFE